MKKMLLLFTFILLTCASLTARAACTISPTSSTTNLGSPTSFVINTTAYTTSGVFTVDCGAGLLVLLGTDNINVKMTAATFSYSTSQAALGLGTDRIPIQLCTDAACGSVITLGGAGITLNRSTLLDLAGLLNGFRFPITLYARTVPGAVVAAGSYTVQLTVVFTYDICTSIGIGSACVLANRQQGSFTVPITLNMTVMRDCTTLTAGNISFNSAPLVSSFPVVNQSINVICTKDSTYTVGITNGIYAVGNQRYMANGSNRLAYQIYKGSSSTYWGPSGTDRVGSATANITSTDGLTKTFNYNALILTNQNTPVAGSYSDTVSVDVSF